MMLSCLRALACVILMLAIGAGAGGCEHIRKATGQPTQAEVDEGQAKYEAAEKELARLEQVAKELQSERDAANDAKARTEAQREQLASIQSKVALELAQAPPEVRPFLESQLDDVRRQMRAIDDQVDAAAAVIVKYETEISRSASAIEAANKELATKAGNLAEMQARADQAIDGLTNAIQVVGQTVGNFVPGAGAISGQVAGGLAAILGLGTATFGATTIRAQSKLKQEKKKLAATQELAEGAMDAIAITEREGLTNIVNDPGARDRAKTAMRSNPKAAKAYALAKVKPVAAPLETVTTPATA